MQKHAVIIEDVDKDGRADLSVYKEDTRLFTIYNLKNWEWKQPPRAPRSFVRWSVTLLLCELVDYGLIRWI